MKIRQRRNYLGVRKKNRKAPPQSPKKNIWEKIERQKDV